MQAWTPGSRNIPATGTPRSTEELIAIGKADNPLRRLQDHCGSLRAASHAGLGQVLREKLMAAIGVRQINNYWRNDGIHEGEAVMQFLEAYDIASGARLMTAEDKQAIKEEMRRCAHFLNGWMLDSSGPIDDQFFPGIYRLLPQCVLPEFSRLRHFGDGDHRDALSRSS